MHSVTVPDGPGELSIRTWGDGDVRMFGVALERDQPGVVYDALGANGARIRLWDAMSEENWADQLALRKPALVILQYGTNESEDDDFRRATYEAALDRVLTKMARRPTESPSSSCRRSTAPSAAATAPGCRTKPVILKLVDAQKRAAAAHRDRVLEHLRGDGGRGGDGALGERQAAARELGLHPPHAARRRGDRRAPLQRAERRLRRLREHAPGGAAAAGSS